MELEIISPSGVLFKGETNYVSFPGTAGSAYLSRARAQRKCKKIMKSLNKIPVSVRINKIV